MDGERVRIFEDPPQICTQRLLLRAMTVKDAADMYEYSSKEETVRYLLWETHASPAYTRAYLTYIETQYRKGTFFDWGVEFEGKLIGTAGYSKIDVKNSCAQIGYVLHPGYWGRGIAPEAARELLCFGFNYLELHRIEALFMAGNDRSRRVMEKCGMTFEGVAKESMFVKGRFRDVGTYAILAEEYFRSHEKKEYRFPEPKKARWFDRLR